VHIDRWGPAARDYLQVVMVAAVVAAHVAEALDLAWQAFRKAAGDHAVGWDMAAATAEVPQHCMIWPSSLPRSVRR
jgi:hypothetical protein